PRTCCAEGSLDVAPGRRETTRRGHGRGPRAGMRILRRHRALGRAGRRSRRRRSVPPLRRIRARPRRTVRGQRPDAGGRHAGAAAGVPTATQPRGAPAAVRRAVRPLRLSDLPLARRAAQKLIACFVTRAASVALALWKPSWTLLTTEVALARSSRSTFFETTV